MSDRLLYDFKGLVTAPGRLARDESSCIEALNVVFPSPGLIEKRKGWLRLAAVWAGTPWKVFTSKEFDNGLVVNYLTALGLASSSFQLGFGDGIFPPVVLATPDLQQVVGTIPTRVQAAQSLRRWYLTSKNGAVRVDSDVKTTLAVDYAGMPRGLPAGRGSALTGSSLLPDGWARAYRITWHKNDAAGVLLSGPPTSRFVVRNQAGSAGYAASTRDAQFVFQVPRQANTDAKQLTTSYFWRLWGNRTFNAAGGADGDDEMYLLQERYLTAGEITAGQVGPIVDNTPDEFLQRQLALNTNAINFPRGELGLAQGIVNADEPPPVAYDVASFANVTWWADVRYRPQGFVSFLSVGAPNGLQDNDTITAQIGATAVTLRAKLVPALATDFQLYTTLATTQMNLEATAQAYCVVISILAHTFNIGLRAYPVGLPSSLAGVVMLEASRVDPTGIGLQFTSSRATWYQYDGSGSGFGLATGFGNEARNATCYSKPDRADAVPLINRFTAGPNNARILRQVPYRGSMFLFTDLGTYRITGRSFADFALEPFALDLVLAAREAVCICDDAVYAWCTAGIARITDSDWTIISAPIEPTVKAVRDASRVNAPDGQFASLAFAIGDTAQHRVEFWYPQAEVGTGDVRGCAFALVFDTRTAAWSTFQFEKPRPTGVIDFRSAGCIREADGIVMLATDRNNNTAEGYLYDESRDITGSSAYFDSDSLGSSVAIASSIGLQAQIPDAGGKVHWQQTVLQLALPLPTLLRLAWYTEARSVQFQPVIPSLEVCRVEPPRAVRRGNALFVSILHETAEPFSLVGVQQRYLAGSPFTRGKAR